MKKLFLSVLALMALASGLVITPSAGATPVGTGYSDTDWVEVQTAANYLATLPNTQVRNTSEMAKFGVATIHYLLAITGKLGTFQQDYSYLNASGPNYLYADYTGDSLRDIQVVMQHYNANPAQAQMLGVAFMNFIAGVDATNKGKDWNTFRPGYVPPAPPAAPTALAAAPTAGGVNLSWTAPPQSVTDFVVQYKASTDGSWTTYNDGVSVAPTATVAVPALADAKTWEFRVSATNAAGASAYSNTATASGCAVTPFNIGACGYANWTAKHNSTLFTTLGELDTLSCVAQSKVTAYMTALTSAIADLPPGNLYRLWLEDAKGALDINAAICGARGWSGWYADVTGFVAAGRALNVVSSPGTLTPTPAVYEDPYHYWWNGFDGAKNTVLAANDACDAGELAAIKDYLGNYWLSRPVANGIAGDIVSGVESASSADAANQAMRALWSWWVPFALNPGLGCGSPQADIAGLKVLVQTAVDATNPTTRPDLAPGAVTPGAPAGKPDSRGFYLLPSERF